MQNENEKTNTTDKINDFIQRNRKSIFIILGTIVVLFLGVISYFIISDNINKKATAKLDELNDRYAAIKFFEDEDYYTEEVETLISDMTEFASKNRGFPASRVWSFTASIYSGRKEWIKAEETWLKSASEGNKTYLGPIALFNAAAAAEELGKYEDAIELLEKCLKHKFEFPAAPRAQFSIGRLYEQQENPTAALEAYRAVLINWPQMPVWQHLARSRIAAIEVE